MSCWVLLAFVHAASRQLAARACPSLGAPRLAAALRRLLCHPLLTLAASAPSPLLQFLAKNGWQLQLQTDRAKQAAALGIDPELCAFGSSGSTNGSTEGRADGSLFLVCTPAAAAGAAQ